jgi:phosphoglycerate dehydrogenase-like enzyme
MPAQDGKWLVANAEPKDKSGETYRILREAGCELVLGRDSWDYPEDEYTEDELIELCNNADVIFAGSRDLFTKRLIESIPNLRIITKHGTGTDRIDVKAATENGVIVAHTPVHSAVVAEHTVAMILSLMKRTKKGDQQVRSGEWRTTDLISSLAKGSTVGILGFGRIGSEIAKRLQGWGVKIVAYDPYAKAEAFEEFGVERCATLDDMLDQTDILSINAVLTEETHHMIGEKALRRLKETAYVVNTSRGEIIDEKALVKALKDGGIAGAALDVMEKEPPDPSSELLQLENVLLTPHMASQIPEIRWMLLSTAMENALSAIRGEVPKYVKNTEVIETWFSRFGKGSR